MNLSIKQRVKQNLVFVCLLKTERKPTKLARFTKREREFYTFMVMNFEVFILRLSVRLMSLFNA